MNEKVRKKLLGFLHDLSMRELSTNDCFLKISGLMALNNIHRKDNIIKHKDIVIKHLEERIFKLEKALECWKKGDDDETNTKTEN